MNPRAANRKGWVPIGIRLRTPEPGVDWVWLGEDRFLDPFFDGTIERALAKPFNALFLHSTPIAELTAWRERSPGLPPAGFIFHMSRCGSTLISQILAALPENVVISEAGPLDVLARASWLPDSLRAEWLLGMMSALGQPRAGSETRCFVKFDSTTALALPFIRAVFPDVPWIFVHRDPEEVLISQLREPAMAMSPGVVTDCNAIGLPLAEAAALPPEEYAARVIGRLCEAALQALDPLGLPVHYTDLPEALPTRIAPHFGFELSPDQLTAMQRVSGYHAKQPRRRFEADGESKRREVSEAVREAAARWIAPHQAALKLRETTPC